MVLRVQAHGEDRGISDKYPSGQLACFPYKFRGNSFQFIFRPPFCATCCNLNVLVLNAGFFPPRQISSAHIVDLTDNHSAERLGLDDHAQVKKLQSAAIISVHVDLDKNTKVTKRLLWLAYNLFPPRRRGEGSPIIYRTSIAPVLITTKAIENSDILSSLRAAPESTISSANPNFLTPGWPGGRMSFLYLFIILEKPLIRFSPDSVRILEFTWKVIPIGSKTREEVQEGQPSNANLSFHSLPYKVTGSPCLSHESCNFPDSRKPGNLNVDVN